MESDIDYSRNLFSYLLEIFLWNEDGMILDVIEKSQVSFDLSELFEIYESSARLLTNLPNIPARRKLLPRFKNLFPVGATLFDHLMEDDKIKDDCLRTAIDMLIACSVWADKETVLQFSSKVLDNQSHGIIEMCLLRLIVERKISECEFDFRDLVGSLKSNHEVFEMMCEHCSRLTDEGRLKLNFKSMEEIWMRIVIVLAEFPVLTENEEL